MRALKCLYSALNTRRFLKCNFWEILKHDSKLFLTGFQSREDTVWVPQYAKSLLSGTESVEWFDQGSPCNLHNRAALGEAGGSHSKNTKCGGWKVEPVSTSVAAEVCVHSGCQRWGKTAPSVTPGAHWKWMGNAAAPDWVCEPSLRPCNLFEMHTLHVNRQLSFMLQRRRVRHRLPQKSQLRNALNHHVAHVKAEIRAVIN